VIKATGGEIFAQTLLLKGISNNSYQPWLAWCNCNRFGSCSKEKRRLRFSFNPLKKSHDKKPEGTTFWFFYKA
jgi:hypothetical protein